MQINVAALVGEMDFITSRSSGAGGQHVNKVETAVAGYWKPLESRWLSEEEKRLIAEKLSHRLTADGALYVRCQVHRSQAANKQEVVKKMIALLGKALEKRRPRLATKPSAASVQRRLEGKKINSDKKAQRRKNNW